MPSFEGQAVQLPSVEGVRGYRAALLPSGWVAIYRHLNKKERLRFQPVHSQDEALLVAGLLRVDEISSPSLVELLRHDQ